LLCNAQNGQQHHDGNSRLAASLVVASTCDGVTQDKQEIWSNAHETRESL